MSPTCFFRSTVNALQPNWTHEGWRIAMSIGREPETKMPSEWASSGCRRGSGRGSKSLQYLCFRIAQSWRLKRVFNVPQRHRMLYPQSSTHPVRGEHVGPPMSLCAWLWGRTFGRSRLSTLKIQRFGVNILNHEFPYTYGGERSVANQQP